MSVKVLFTYDYGKENMEKISRLGYEIILKKERELTYSAELKDIEVLVCYNPFPTLDINMMESLRWIQLSSIGIDQLPMESVIKRKIRVTNNKGGYSIPIGEWIVLKILELLKRSHDLHVNQMNREWKMRGDILELYGKTIGFIGTGSLAQEAAKRLQGFGVRILGVNTTGERRGYFEECFSLEQKEKMLVQSDIVVLTVPYTKQTRYLINEDVLSATKRGAYLVNVSRGEIIKESALIDALQDGRLAGAALDVVEGEPLDSNSELWNLENIIITPHNSWVSEERNNRRFQILYENLRKYIEKEPLLNVVDLEKGY